MVELQKQPAAVCRRFIAKYFTSRRRKRETAWNCTKCSQSFKRNSRLKKHLKVHKRSVVLVTGGGAAEVTGGGAEMAGEGAKATGKAAEATGGEAEVTGGESAEATGEAEVTGGEAAVAIGEAAAEATGREGDMAGGEAVEATGGEAAEATEVAGGAAEVAGGGAVTEDWPNLVCQVCAKEFGSRKALGSHLKHVHPTLSFQCDQCQNKFPSKRSLKQHTSRVHNDVVYQCPLCLTEFRQKHNRRAHLKKCKEGEMKKPKSWSELSPNAKVKKRKELRKKFLQDTKEMSEG